MSCENCLSRREFLTRSTLAVAGAAGLATGCGDGQFGPTALSKTTTATAFKVSSLPGLATTGQFVKLPPEIVDSRGAPVLMAVKRLSPTSFFALSTVCTHQGCEINIRGSAFECPCHNAGYDSDGKVTQQPRNTTGSATNLPTYATRYDAQTDTLTIG